VKSFCVLKSEKGWKAFRRSDQSVQIEPNQEDTGQAGNEVVEIPIIPSPPGRKQKKRLDELGYPRPDECHFPAASLKDLPIVQRLNMILLSRIMTNNMIPEATIEEEVLSKIECRRCGHSWFKRKNEESHVCPMCNTPYEEDEESNLLRKN
jgi:hypothetical protein